MRTLVCISFKPSKHFQHRRSPPDEWINLFFWTQQAHDGAYLTHGAAIMDLILLQSRFIAVGTLGLLRPLEVRIKMRGYLQAWKPSIFTAGLVFSDAIVDNTIVGNQMFILRGILGKNMSRNAAISAMQMSLRSLMAIIGSFLTDAYIGKYHMIIISTIIYIIALVILSCLIWKEGEASIYITCFLMAIGQGCFEPLLENHGEDQINAYYEGKRRAKVLHEIWWWTPRFLGSALGPIIVLIAEEYGWKFSCWLTTGVMVVAFISFLCGRSANNLDKDKSPKSPLTRVIRVFVAAMLNRHLHCPMDATHLHENLEKEHDHLLPHTNSLRCLDKAAIPPSPEDAEKNKWRLCRVTEVEENKILLGTLPIWVTLVMCGIVLSVQQTLFVEQAYHMERALGSVKVPVTSLFVLAGLSKAAIYGVHFTPLDRITILGHGITPKLQIGFGMFSSILCCMTAALVERKRLDAYNRHYFVSEENEEDPKAVQVSIFWLLPQFFLIGAMDGLISCGIKDFFNDHLPDCMKSFEYTFSQSVLASGYFLFALLATIMNKATKWFGDDINFSHLDYFYWELGILSFINLCIYAYISQRYSPMRKGRKNGNDPNNGNNNDNGEATTSAKERTMTTEMATVEQQESSTHIASSEYI